MQKDEKKTTTISGRKTFAFSTFTEKSKQDSARMSRIGNEIESFVQSHNVGADAWRRTGVMTFDGNIHSIEKVTYERIRPHLETVYKRPFSYGTSAFQEIGGDVL